MPDPSQDALPDWRRAGARSGASGLLRCQSDDFFVDELLDIDFSGDGEHDWLHIEKCDTNTAWLARQLARYAGVTSRDVGYAGLKDRHAVTRQWFSVRRASTAGHDWQQLQLPGVRLLRETRHYRKLRRGAHRGNRFSLLLRELHGDPQAALERVRRDGVPNYFGEQRFGRDAGNLALAAALFRGKRLGRDKRSIALSAARACLYNHLLHRRVAEGTWNCLLDGDIAVLDGSNSHFAVPAVDAELEARCSAGDLHPSGPLWGRRAVDSPRSPGELAVAAEHPDLATGLERHVDAARRPLRLIARELDWALESGGLRIAFELPAGAFATAVLREILDYRDAAGRQAAR